MGGASRIAKAHPRPDKSSTPEAPVYFDGAEIWQRVLPLLNSALANAQGGRAAAAIADLELATSRIIGDKPAVPKGE